MKLIILGSGGYGRTVADVADQLGIYETIDFLDDNDKNAVGKCEDYFLYADANTWFYPAFGNNPLRVGWIRKFNEHGCQVATIVHPKAYVSPKAKLSSGTVVLPGAIVNTNTVVGMGVIINCGAIVDHDCELQEGVHVCLNAVVKADNHLPAYTKIEAGQIVSNGEYPLVTREN